LTFRDANGNTTSYTYSGSGNMTGIEDPLHDHTTLTYTSSGRVQTVTDANSHTTTVLYDSQDRGTTIQFADSTSNVLTFNSQGNVTKVADGRNNATTYSYDVLNRRTGSTDALNNGATQVYDSGGNLTQDQEPTPGGQTARTTAYAYDSLDRVTTITDPLGHQTIVGYDGDGNKLTVKDPLGRITTAIFDAMDRATVVIDPMSGRTTTTFDADGEPLTVTDPMGRVTSYTYSVRGWVANVTDGMGNLATLTYSATGKQLGLYQQQGAFQQTQTKFYDAADRLISDTDGNGHTTSYGYDGVGNQTSVRDANNNITTIVYDSRNRAATITDALGHNTVIGFDNSGNQQTVKDALGHTTTVLYDALNRATTMVSAISGTTTIAYDAAGRRTGLTDPVGNQTQWSYDSDDRVALVTQPNSATVTYLYDNGNQLTETTDANSRRTTFSYDNNGNQTGETWVGASPSEKITYTYDADSELTGVKDSYATLTFTYDSRGRLTSAATSGPGTGQPSVLLSNTYDQVGDLTSVTDNISGNAGITTYSYDAGQRVTRVTTSYGGNDGPQVSFGYDNANRLTSTSRQIGSGNATQVNTTIVYDNGNRVGTITDGVSTFVPFPPTWTTTPLTTYVYSYDNANRVTSENDAEGTASFTYDNANELTGVTGSRTESYSYDLNGNRTGTGYSTMTMNEIRTSPGLITYAYDSAGNTISANSGGNFTTYTYDYHNRLTGVKQGGTVIATYTYDALNRRIGVQEGGSTTWTVFNGRSPDAMPYADFSGSGGALLTRYLHGPGVVNGAVVDALLARTSSGGTTAWYLPDKLGSVRDIASSSGSLQDHVVYDSIGSTVTETNASNGDRFKFAGMQWDSVTNQYFDHARWYSSRVGRFLSEDPLGFAAGDANLYRNVGNAYPNNTDPSGEQPAFFPPPGQGKFNYWNWANNAPLTPATRLPFSLADIELLMMMTEIGTAGANIIRKYLGGSLAIVLAPLGPGIYGETDTRQSPVTITLDPKGTDIAAMVRIAGTLVHELGHASGLSEVNCRILQIYFYIQLSMALGVDVMPQDLIDNGSVTRNPVTGDWEPSLDGIRNGVAGLGDDPDEPDEPPPVLTAPPPPALTIPPPLQPPPPTNPPGPPP
jgi:RHS repeat-associated protein